MRGIIRHLESSIIANAIGPSAPGDNHFDQDDASSAGRVQFPHIARHQIMLCPHIGTTIRKYFFISGIRGAHDYVDYVQGKVVSMTANNKYNVMYSDMDTEEIRHKDLLILSKDAAQQIENSWSGLIIAEESDLINGGVCANVEASEAGTELQLTSLSISAPTAAALETGSTI